MTTTIERPTKSARTIPTPAWPTEIPTEIVVADPGTPDQNAGVAKWTTSTTDYSASVRTALVEAGISIAEVCRRTGIPRMTLTRHMRGRGEKLKLNELFAISQTLGISVARLCFGPDVDSAEVGR